MREKFMTRRNIGLGLVVIIGIGLVVYFTLFKKISSPPPAINQEANDAKFQQLIIGKSVEGRNIIAYTYGQGATHLLFVGGIHGGYEWNSVVLAYQFMDYLEANLNFISSKDLKVTVIPSANPDGVYKIIGKDGRFVVSDVPTGGLTEVGRFNANEVDLNRNFDCNWKATSTWRSKIVNAGTSAFSEPESKVIRDFILKNNLSAVVFWHSQSGTVYASQCQNGIIPETLELMSIYAQASGYKADKTFDSYAITGAVEDWLASIGIPAITVELKTHETVEWTQNLLGIQAIFNYFGTKGILP